MHSLTFIVTEFVTKKSIIRPLQKKTTIPQYNRNSVSILEMLKWSGNFNVDISALRFLTNARGVREDDHHSP